MQQVGIDVPRPHQRNGAGAATPRDHKKGRRVLTVNSNLPSLNAQRNLSASGSALSGALQRLSSGLRVNSARDDAAGLAIASRMMAQVRGINQGIRNSADGLSMVQTAESAMGQVQEALQKMRELAVQGANSTLGADERSYIAGEMRELRDHVDNVARTTPFNGTKLLDGSTGAGGTPASTATVLDGASSLSVGHTINGIGLGQSDSIAITAIDVSGADPGKTFTFTTAGGFMDPHELRLTDGTTSQTLNVFGSPSETLDFSDFGVQITLQTTPPGSSYDSLFTNSQFTGETIVTSSQVTPAVPGGLELQIGGDAGENSRLSLAMVDARMSGSAGTNDMTALNTVLDAFMSAPTRLGAHDLIADIDDAIDYVSRGRSRMGAQQNRIESAIASYQVQSENVAAARGRIVDADFAVETANLSRAQILQQAGMAMLAQANAMPQNVLSLLR